MATKMATKMATYGRSKEVRKMGLGALVVRTAVIAATGGILYASVLNPVVNWIRKDNAVVEKGYVSPKSLSIQGKKNSTGNIETYLNYKNGEETVSLPCMKGPDGPLCGSVEYWWRSVGAAQREELSVGEWPVISKSSKYGIMSTELQAMLDAFYGMQNGVQKAQPPLQQPLRQYKAPDEQKQR